VKIDVCIETGHAARLILAGRWPRWFFTTPAASPSQSPAWLIGWSAARSGQEQAVVMAKSGGHVLAALPLAVQGAAAAVVAPRGPLHPVGAAACDPRIVRALLLGAARRWPALTVEHVPLVSVMGLVLEDLGWRQDYASIPAIPVAGLPPAAPGRAPAARLWAAHTAAGRATYTRSTTPAELDRGIRDLLTLRRASAAAADTWAGILRRLGPQIATTATLHLDGRPVAARLCLYRGRRVYSVLGAARSRAADHAPGDELLRALVRDLSATPAHTSLALWDEPAAERRSECISAHGPVWQTTVTYTRSPAAPPLPDDAEDYPAAADAAAPSAVRPGRAAGPGRAGLPPQRR
jgi:hypothetical protein